MVNGRLPVKGNTQSWDVPWLWEYPGDLYLHILLFGKRYVTLRLQVFIERSSLLIFYIVVLGCDKNNVYC